ncbi:MAG: GNAT family N-acetyltransferase [Gammaproteobacteria bacterium]
MSTEAGPGTAGLRIVEPGTPAEFDRYYELRWRVLRAPWDQPRGSERDASDASAVHLMACNPRGIPVAVARLHFSGACQAQVRYMAVDSDYRGQGIGRRLLDELETRALHNGVHDIVLDAREGAVAFYERCGYRVQQPAHTLYGTIRHWRMDKQLLAPPTPNVPGAECQ